jgi:hypothetical protein
MVCKENVLDQSGHGTNVATFSLVKYNVKNSGNRDEVNRQLLTKKSKRRHRIFTPNAAWLTTLRGGITEAN